MSEPNRTSPHLFLGGGVVADVLLWRKCRQSVGLLAGSTALWLLFERAGYSFVSFVSNVLLLLVVILFVWAKSASLLNRPLPPLPSLEISEKTVIKAADEMRLWVNHALSIAHGIAIGGNFRLFLQVAIGLWVISYVGSFFNFLTLVYIGVLLSLSMPVVYEKYQNPIDKKLSVAYKILSKLPLSSNKEKKTQ